MSGVGTAGDSPSTTDDPTTMENYGYCRGRGGSMETAETAKDSEMWILKVSGEQLSFRTSHAYLEPV